LTYHSCRAAHPRGQYFTINECPTDHVINIQSAELGYSRLHNLTDNPPLCPGNDCTRSTDVPATTCNGRRTCSISQTVLLFPTGPPLCGLSRDGNFIRIEFTCVTGTINLLFLFIVFSNAEKRKFIKEC